jgi:hypothetical protein
LDINRHYRCFKCSFDLRTTNWELKKGTRCPQCYDKDFYWEVMEYVLPDCYYYVKMIYPIYTPYTPLKLIDPPWRYEAGWKFI